jgi:hypothetical protein
MSGWRVVASKIILVGFALFAVFQLGCGILALVQAAVLSHDGGPVVASVQSIYDRAENNGGQVTEYTYEVGSKTYRGNVSWGHSAPRHGGLQILVSKSYPAVNSVSIGYLERGALMSLAFAAAAIGIPIWWLIRLRDPDWEETLRWRSTGLGD